jgi:hypothetical protein
MIVLNTSTDPQTFRFIPRNGNFTVMEIADEIENTTVEVTIEATGFNGYTYFITGEFNLIEGRTYMLTLKTGSTIIYRDKIYCTDSPLNNFSVNYSQYTENVSNNEFIVI